MISYMNYKYKLKKYKTKYDKLRTLSNNMDIEKIKERLANSFWPYQIRDFYFLTIPEGYPNAGKEVPIDYLLKNLILFFWDKGFITMGTDQGDKNRDDELLGFISIDAKMINGEASFGKLVDIISEKFGMDGTRIINKIPPVYKNDEEYEKDYDKQYIFTHNYLKKYPKKIIINVVKYEDGTIGFHRIFFNTNSLPWIHKKMKLELPSHEDAYPGSLIEIPKRKEDYIRN